MRPLSSASQQKKVKAPRNGFLGYSLSDTLAITVSFALPVVIFAAVWILVSYDWHYRYAVFDAILVIAIFGVVAFIGFTAIKRMLQNADGATDHFAVWAATLFIGVLLAYFGALTFGWRNYGNNMQPYYEYKELNSYTDVDAGAMEGKAFMDAGAITFEKGTHLDFTKSAGFMNLDMYCVAPIVSSGAAPAAYDFWAIGLNCCTGAAQNFACGQAANSETARGGLRLMSDTQLPFYKMAVTQAETKYGIKSSHPIFFYWVEDTSAAMETYQGTGWRAFASATLWFALVQALVVIVGAFG